MAIPTCTKLLRSSKYYDRGCRYFELEILKYYAFHTLNLKYSVFRMKYLMFQKRCEIPGFLWILCMSSSIGIRVSLGIRRLLSKYYMPVQPDQQEKHSTHLLILFPI